jgi:hypothetical protein
VEAFVGPSDAGSGWFVYDAGQAYFMASSTGLPLVDNTVLEEGITCTRALWVLAERRTTRTP